MPHQVRIISRRNSPKWDDLVRGALGSLGIEYDYFGIANADRADAVRRGIRTAARHQGLGCKAFYGECKQPGACQDGGPDCRYHVYYTLYNLDEARKYKAQQASGGPPAR